jgi:K+-transporting ATPase A subunit
MYQGVFFRVISWLFLFFGAYVIIYSLVVIAMKMVNKKMEKQLNDLLKERKDQTPKDE